MDVGVSRVRLRDRLASIDTHVDDVQSGAEACSRTANTLIRDASGLEGHLKGPFGRTLRRHMRDLQAYALDQQTALRDLRASLALLRDELAAPQRAAIRPPPYDPKAEDA